MEYPIVKIAYNGMQSRKETQNISVHYKCSNLYLNNELHISLTTCFKVA